MEQIFDQTLSNINFKENPLVKAEYDHCIFKNCDISDANLSGFIFADCQFIDCNLSLSKLQGTIIRDVSFKDCKMLGMPFDKCNEFALSFSFENCILNHSTFYLLKLKKTKFINSQIQEADFSECDLTEAVFTNCDLFRSTFDGTILEKADFRTSYHYAIDPEINKIKKAKFSLGAIAGLLEKYDIQIDQTT